MKPKLFPDHFNVLLDASERSAMEELYDLDPLVLDELEMLHKVIRAGIKVMNHDAAKRRKDPDSGPTRSEVEARMKSEASEDSDPSVENYECLPLEERFRRKVETFLREHPYFLPKHEALALLLHLGIDRAEETASLRKRIQRQRPKVV